MHRWQLNSGRSRGWVLAFLLIPVLILALAACDRQEEYTPPPATIIRAGGESPGTATAAPAETKSAPEPTATPAAKPPQGPTTEQSAGSYPLPTIEAPTRPAYPTN